MRVSNVTNGSGSDHTIRTDTKPRAMIHKKVLDIARENPNATAGRIAEEVSGVSATFVERILDEYGDPAANGRKDRRVDGGPASNGSEDRSSEPAGDDSSATEAEEPVTDPSGAEAEESVTDQSGAEAEEPVTDQSDAEAEEPVTDPSELTTKQRETLREVYKQPTASQKEISERLDVSRATISKRVNGIPGFDWRNRHAFVERLYGDQTTADDGSDLEPRDGPMEQSLMELNSRIEELERRVDERRGPAGNDGLDPELVHKVAHACLEVEHITTDEELEILGRLLDRGD
jgi:DNA-binding CsgD family transcriptional regulator